MARLWTLGGLSLFDLVRRTARESWEDSVFGQGGRMAFYQFLALFPSLALFLAIVNWFPNLGDNLKNSLLGASDQVMPGPVSELLRQIAGQQSHAAISGVRFLFAAGGALWAAFNATWAMVYGLNRAYEVDEQRSKWQLAITIAGLTVAMALTGCLAIFVIFFGSQLRGLAAGSIFGFRALQWAIPAVWLSLVFALLYRFAPNVADHEWSWSTPGALCALLLWIAATVGTRLYFERINNYSLSYGSLNRVAMLLLWLYVTDGAILIGGEMNSEIEKAVTHRPDTPRRLP